MHDSIIILGPTASGKTSISIKLAKILNTEIINADSMYIYDKLNIGTAKPTIEEMDGIKHHLVGFVDPHDSYSVSQFRNDAKTAIQSIIDKNLLPIIVGGTGFYIDSLINNFSYGETIRDEELRTNLQHDLEKFGKEYLYKKLQSLDPESAKRLHINDTKRIIRAIEIALNTNSVMSNIKNLQDNILKKPLIIGLNFDREKLYEKINIRVDTMIKNGLIDEVKYLYDILQLSPEKHQSMKGIGYKEIIEYLNGNINKNEAIEKIKQHSRNYAKRQITWFKRNQNIIWLDPNDDNIINKIISILNKKMTT